MLLETLGGFDIEVVADPGGDGPSSWRSHRACLASIGPAATHLLVVQDDALPCRGFPTRAACAIDRTRDDLLALFTPGFPTLARAATRAAKARQPVVRLPLLGFVPTVAIVYPAPLARDLLAWADDNRGDVIADDTIVCRWAKARRLHVWATVPSLVDHDDSRPSLFGKPHGRGDPRRRAALFDG